MVNMFLWDVLDALRAQKLEFDPYSKALFVLLLT